MLGLDPTMLQMLFGMIAGGGGAGGGVPTAGTPPMGGSPIPFVPETGALPASVGPAPQDQGPMAGGPGTMGEQFNSMKTAAGFAPSTPPMSASPGVPYGDQSQTMGSLGEALQPRPAPGTPMPMARPEGLGQPTGGAGTPGYYGGSPETNPNLKPITGAGGQQQRAPVDIAKLLSGIKAPAGPDVVKPSTPAAPRTGSIGQSNLVQLLMSLGMGGKSLRGPTTLGQALENRPSAWGGLYG